MTASPDANDVLFGTNKPSARFETPGTTVGGKITAPPRTRQEQEWNNVTQRSDGPPKFFPSGDPIMSIMVDVQTQLRDPQVENDDGQRTIYIQGKRLKDAVRDAVKAVGGERLEVGGELHVTFTHLGEAPSVGANQPKEWAVRYVPASQTALQQPQQPQQSNPWQQGTPAAPQQAPPVQQQPAQTPLPPQQPPAAPQQAPANAPTPEAIKALRNAGVDPVTVYPGYDGSLG
jgi:hypothetical protein